MIAETFTVIGGHKHKPLPAGPHTLQALQQDADLGVDVRDLAVVRLRRES